MARVYLDTNGTFTASDNNVTAYGSIGIEVVTIKSGIAGITLDSNIERIRLAGISTDYKFKQLGNKLEIYDANGNKVVKTGLQDDNNGTQLTFDNGTMNAKLVPNTTGFSLTVGDKTISSDANAIKEANMTTQLDLSDAKSGAKVFLDTSDYVFHVNDNNSVGFGARESQAILIGKDTTGTIVNANVERVQFDGSYQNYKFQQSGITLRVLNSLDKIIANVNTNDTGTLLTFSEGTVKAKLVPPSQPGMIPYISVGDAKANVGTGQKINISNAYIDTTLVSPITVDSSNLDKKHIAIISKGSSDALSDNFQFDFNQGEYNYEISNFSSGDVLNFPDNAAAVVKNANFSDGKVQLQYGADGQLIEVSLVGLTTAQDQAIYGTLSFKTVFGNDSII